MPTPKYDVRMPEFHRLAIVMAGSRDLYENSGGKNSPRGPAGLGGKKCPECKSTHYAKCSVEGCGFSMCLACMYSEHPERAYADHR